ncbi:unnamed protein product [Rotaria magnacalcarata]|uniref:Riboflavin transporter n=1 Tax=Rotaria magnacalcarata TaxID=392030 RepID=A0A815SGI1_9BILA|nr:unnamed protein product [Rotaria magnacalcarata]CAF2165697.1 unnamed protein product [Rotaria magnacalcarata]
MNLSAWIDLQGIFVELPIMVLLTPEGWALPSLINLSISIANIVPLLLVLLRWHQGSRFSEIPYIYIIILVGAISCGGLALFWQKTIFFFGSQRIFFDYMKRFQSKYLTAVFLGEGLTAAIPTLLALAQGSMGDPICIENINSTGVQPVYPQPRFSVTVFLLLMTFIIIASLFAFMLLRWTKIISMAGAAEKETPTKVVEDPVLVGNHDLTMDPFFQPSKTSRCFHVIAFVRITIGNRIKIGWNGDEGLFYFGASLQLGFLLGTTPVYLLINNFGMFIDRQPCQKYCIE